MKFLIAIFLYSFSARAATPAAVPSVTVSAPGANTGQVSISPSQLSGTGTNGIFSLYGFNTSTTTARFFPFYKNGVAYQVTAGKSAYCFDITASSGTGSSAFQLLSDTAAITPNASTLTAGIFQGGVTTNYVDIAGATANVPGIVPGVYVFAASTYPGFQIGAAVQYTVHMDCYEQ